MKISNVLFCDDIRHEINNKISLIGLYNEKIVIKPNSATAMQFPIGLRLSVFFRFCLENKNEKPKKFEFSYWMNTKNILNVSGEINDISTSSPNLQLALNLENIAVEPGNLEYFIRLFNESGEALLEEKKQAIKIVLE